MPAIPIKERWWKSKGAPDPKGDWALCFSSSSNPKGSWLRFKSYADHLEFTNYGRRYIGIDPDVVSQLSACVVCGQWDQSAIIRPIDLPLLPTAKRDQSFNTKSIQRLWAGGSSTSYVTIVHRRLMDAIEPFTDDHLLRGKVYLIGQGPIDDLVTLLDRKRVSLRVRYARNELNYSNRSFMPCHECGRLLPYQHLGKRYIVKRELESRNPRVVGGKLLLPPEIIERLGLRDKERWPGMVLDAVLDHDEPLDPIPVPYPIWWDDFEAFMIRVCGSMPFPRTCLPNHTEPGDWLRKRIQRTGQDVCMSQGSKHQDPYIHWTHLFFLRFRSLFETRVAKRIDTWTDQQLFDFLRQYHEASWRTGSYFPV